MKRFPTRTLVLMILALVAFAWMWWQTRHAREAQPVRPAVTDVQIVSPVGGDR